jgi:hypothetical protein
MTKALPEPDNPRDDEFLYRNHTLADNNTASQPFKRDASQQNDPVHAGIALR